MGAMTIRFASVIFPESNGSNKARVEIAGWDSLFVTLVSPSYPLFSNERGSKVTAIITVILSCKFPGVQCAGFLGLTDHFEVEIHMAATHMNPGR